MNEAKNFWYVISMFVALTLEIFHHSSTNTDIQILLFILTEIPFFLFSMWKLLAQLYNSKMRGKSMKITLDENFSFAAEKFCCVWTQIDRERARRMPQSETPNVYFGRMRVVDMSRVMRARVYFGENIEQNVKIWGRMSRK